MPLFRSTRAAKSSNVSGVSALIVKSDMPATYIGLRTFGVRWLTLPQRRKRRAGPRLAEYSDWSKGQHAHRQKRACALRSGRPAGSYDIGDGQREVAPRG